MKAQKNLSSAQQPGTFDKALLQQWAIKDNNNLRKAVQKVYQFQTRRQELQEEMSDPFYASDNEHFMGNDYY